MPIKTHPTGVIQYNPHKAWSGYTLVPATQGMSAAQGAILIDMNGNIVNKWQGLMGAFDCKMLKGGDVLGTSRYSPGYWLDCMDISQRNWKNEAVWKFDHADQLVDFKTGEKFWSARAHHDFQREGSPCGYFTPGQEARQKGNTLINSSRTVEVPDLCPLPIADSWLIEIDEDGNILWDWQLMNHWDELGLDEIAKAIFHRYHIAYGEGHYVKEIYLNNVACLGPNKWYDGGDERFHPENIISDIRIFNCSFIISKKSKKIVWRLGPDFTNDSHTQKIGQIVGQHQVHMVAKSLPGEGNILIFDNGGEAGVGRPTPCAPTGYNNCTRGYSRVLEINPITLDIVGGYNHNIDDPIEQYAHQNLLYSAYCSGMDRLPNGNTLITETFSGRAIEVTLEGEIVWEYYYPGGAMFRVHRYPYDWVPLSALPIETPIVKPINKDFRVTPDGGIEQVNADDIFIDKPQALEGH